MTNQLAKQMLNNLAKKAGQAIDQEDKTMRHGSSRINVNQQEEQMLVDLIHLRNNLYPEKPIAAENKMNHHKVPMDDGTSKMISLSELAQKFR